MGRTRIEGWGYVRAGRSRSSRPPQTSASGDTERVRAQVAVRLRQLILLTLSEFVHHRKGSGSGDPSRALA